MMSGMVDSLGIVGSVLLKARQGTSRLHLRMLLVLMLTLLVLGLTNSTISSNAVVSRDNIRWIGMWAAAPENFIPKNLHSFRNQSLRLIAHISIGGKKVRIQTAKQQRSVGGWIDIRRGGLARNVRT